MAGRYHWAWGTLDGTAGIIPILLREVPTVPPPCEQKQARRVEWN